MSMIEDDIEHEEEALDDGFRFEPEEEETSVAGMAGKIKKMRAELAAEKEKSKEYLDGWQRAKADLANVRRDMSEQVVRASQRGREDVIASVIPVLDSFDMAASGEAWARVDAQWRTGIESIRNQLVGALEQHGVSRVGAVGDLFDPRLHEAVQEINEGDEAPHTVMRVLRSGYKMGEYIVRPAQVAIRA